MIGCLCLHGFTGAPYEVEPLANFLKSKTDWKIVVPTLPGHGEKAALKGIASTQWFEYAEAEMRLLLKECEEVYVVGFSMGGLIAVYLAEKYPVKKLILLSAAVKYINAGQMAADIAEMFRDVRKGSLANNELFRRYKDKLLITPLSATLQFRKVVRCTRPLLKKIQIPTFIAQGTADGIVPPKSAGYIYERIGSKRKELYYALAAKHHICHTGEWEILFEKVFTFLTNSSRVS